MGANQFQYQARVLPPYSGPENVTADRWLPTLTRPLRRAFAVALLTSGSVAPPYVPRFPYEGLAPTFAQPDRRPRYARGFKAEVLTTAGETPTADRTPPVWPQPSRAVRYASGTTLASPVVPQATPLFRRALAAHLLNDPGIAAVVGTRVYPQVLPQNPTLPALTYQVVGNPRRPVNLASPNTLATARVQITAHSKRLGECEPLAEAVRQALQGFTGRLGGLNFVVVSSILDDETDLGDNAQDGTESTFRRIAVDYLIRYREPRPARFTP